PGSLQVCLATDASRTKPDPEAHTGTLFRGDSSAMSKQLVVISGKDKGRSFTLPESGNLSIGRGNTTDTRLTDVRVSRTACEVEHVGAQVVLSDTQSAVGTAVNDQRIGSSHQLTAGDVIRIGATEMRLEDEDIALQQTVAGVLPQEFQQTIQKPVAAKT